MTLDELGERLFASAPEAASILGRDVRTIRSAVKAGEIPVSWAGRKPMIPVSWLRGQAAPSAAPAPSVPDIDDLADKVADRLFARFAQMAASTAGTH